MVLQEARRLMMVTIGNVKGTRNPSNALTKHLASKAQVEEAIGQLGQVDCSEASIQQKIAHAKQLQIAEINETGGAKRQPRTFKAWKPCLPTAVTLST